MRIRRDDEEEEKSQSHEEINIAIGRQRLKSKVEDDLMKNIWKSFDKEALYNLIQNLKMRSTTKRKMRWKVSRMGKDYKNSLIFNMF